jgi:hypothetical protein
MLGSAKITVDLGNDAQEEAAISMIKEVDYVWPTVADTCVLIQIVQRNRSKLLMHLFILTLLIVHHC